MEEEQGLQPAAGNQLCHSLQGSDVQKLNDDPLSPNSSPSNNVVY